MTTTLHKLIATVITGITVTTAVAWAAEWRELDTFLPPIAAAEREDVAHRFTSLSQDPEPIPSHAQLVSGDFKYVGTASCAASNCHGGARETSSRMSDFSYSVWINEDPHARAYQTLTNSRSKDIAKKLGLKNPPHQDCVCLACHSTNVSPAQLVTNHRYTVQDGVGCESCHGAAEKWLEPHKRDAWQALDGFRKKVLPTDRKNAVGFNDTSDLVTRAQTCVKCHVGSPGRDVNHNLIAAGHPRLNFELSAYLAMMPPHWSRRDDKQTDRYEVAGKEKNSAALEARLWAIGQVVSASAAAELLAERSANPTTPWPEFAEYGCFACHHDLRDDRWRRQQPRRPDDGPPGTLPWETWHTPLLPIVHGPLSRINDPDEVAGTTLKTTLREVKLGMGHPYPDREKIRQLASTLKSELDGVAAELTQVQFSDSVLWQYLSDVSDTHHDTSSSNWDSVAQRYLAAVALRQAIRDSWQAHQPQPDEFRQLTGKLEIIRDQLWFSEGDELPLYNSPWNYGQLQHETITRSFDKIHQMIEDRK